ncbi:MAG: hypothetical protein EOP83_24190 [Verrucomicrobiaceae bacterium]|nr:MAG: hypothetical protein EOP83_24190 [Verrucomicrobiaceae bacterium]
MKQFGCRATFGIEVGDAVDTSSHFLLDFYLRGIHLNWADNRGYLGSVAHYFPIRSVEQEHLVTPKDSFDMLLGGSISVTLAALLGDNDLYQKYSRLDLGPVTDSFSLVVLPNATGVVLIGIRNDGWGGDDPNLPNWNETIMPDGELVHWLSVALAADEYLKVVDGARHAILDLRERSASQR